MVSSTFCGSIPSVGQRRLDFQKEVDLVAHDPATGFGIASAAWLKNLEGSGFRI